MEINVKYFAIIRESLGRSEERKEVPEGTTAGQVLDQLGREFPNLAPLKPALMLMVNQEYARQDHVLRPGDELALIPPVSGGSASCCRVR
jgi:MoaE-MoaD fusion protein